MPLDSLRHALRSIRRAPSLAMVSILTVALGIGAGTALFSVIKAVLLNPLPYPSASRLMWISEVSDRGNPMDVALLNFEDWQRQNHSFQKLTAFGAGPVNAGGGDSPQRTYGAEVTQDFFDVMGVHPALGRTFDASEERLGAAGTVVLGNALWRRAYGADPRILGRKIKLMGQPFTVIGVMPPGFDYPNQSEIWIAAGAFFPDNSRTGHNFRVVGRLRDGVTLEQAQSDIGAISHRLKLQFPSPFMGKDALVVRLDRHIFGEARPVLLMLFSSVGFLLLIVCVNVANLMLVRMTARVRELSIRVAMGAGRLRLFQQLLTESLIIAIGGGALGLVAALFSMDLIRVLLPADLPRAADIHIDAGVIAFALGLSAVTGILFGVLPAWRASRLNVNEALKAASRSHTSSRGSHRVQGALVVSEVCLSLVLVAGAGLLANSFWNLRRVDPGFKSANVLVSTVSFEVPTRGFVQLTPIFDDLLRNLRTIPGVESAAIGHEIPLDAFHPDGHFRIENRPESSGAVAAGYRVISPGYLRTMRIPLLRGRDLSEDDRAAAAPVAVINREMARVYFPNEDPIGRRVWFDSFAPDPQWVTIVGIAGDVLDEGLTKSIEPTAYVSYAQVAAPQRLLDEYLILRTQQDPLTIVSAVRDRLRNADPEAAVGFLTMDNLMSRSVARQRFQMQVLGAFAALALILAAIGLYGVLSYVVASSRTEIAIRMALGAQPVSIFKMVMARALRLSFMGSVIGILGCLAVRGVLSSLLYGIGPSDPATLALATILLLAVALIASYNPARRAMKIEPGIALQEN